MSRLGSPGRAAVCAAAVLASLAWAAHAGPRAEGDRGGSDGLRVDVVVTGIPRPLQLAFDREGVLVALAQGWRGDAAGELYRFDVRGAAPIDAGRAPRVVIPFASEPRKTTLGSLAVDRRSGDLFLGEENGNRIYRFGAGQRLEAAAVGLNYLLGGSTIAVDPRGRLVILDFASPEMQLRSEAPLPPSLSWLVEEGYRGPLIFRVAVDDEQSFPRRADLLLPLFPRHGAAGDGREPMWRLIGVAPLGDDLVLLNAVGEVLRLGGDGALRLLARLPAGHYHRTNLAAGQDGSVYVCGGFQIRRIFRISPAGEVRTVAAELGDPGGIVLDRAGALYVAETALHRILRIAPDERR